jgi:ABC-type spermidine/putrescine transport system permease subunit II
MPMRAFGSVVGFAIVAALTLLGVITGLVLSIAIDTGIVRLSQPAQSCLGDDCIGPSVWTIAALFFFFSVFGISGGVAGFVYGMGLAKPFRRRAGSPPASKRLA